MEINNNDSFGMLEPLMIAINEHIKDGAEEKTNSQHFNIVWSKIHRFIKDNKMEILFQFSKETP
jgi:hypothetical protein